MWYKNIIEENGVSFMEKRDVEKLLESLNGDFFKQMDEQMANIKSEIGPDPSIGEIRELLGEVPAQIEYLKVRTIEVRKKVQDLKLIVKAKRNSLEIKKSKIRQETLEGYQKDLKEYITTAKSLFDDVTTGKKKLPNTVLQEMIKAIKPEKPTQNHLDDMSNLKTEKEQTEIFAYEKKIIEYEELYGVLNAMAEKYENKNLAVRAHKGLMEAEMRNNINN